MLRKLFTQYRARLHAYLLGKTSDPDLAADLVQETFLRLMERDNLPLVRNQPSYVFKIANNLLIDHRRQAQTRKTEHVTNDELNLIVDEQQTEPEDQVIHASSVQRLREILKQLPLRSQKIFVLCRLEGRSYAEVARLLGISTSLVGQELASASLFIAERYHGYTPLNTFGKPSEYQ